MLTSRLIASTFVIALLCTAPVVVTRAAHADQLPPSAATSTAPPVNQAAPAAGAAAPITDTGTAAEPNAAPSANGGSTEHVVSSSEATSRPPQPKVGFDIGWYFPTDSVVQNRFGADWFSIGVGVGGVPTVTGKRGEFRLDLDVEANAKGNNRAILIPLGLQFETGLSTGGTVPYVGVSADFVSSVIQSQTDNVKSEYRPTAGGSAFAGLNFHDDANIEARYRWMPLIAGYNLNGAEVLAGVRF